MDAVSLLGAGMLDRVLGDPPWLPHPVRGVGRLIQWADAWRPDGCRGAFVTGCFLAAGLPLAAYLGTAGLLLFARQGGIVMEMLLSLYLMSTCLAYRGLAKGVEGVYKALKDGELTAARRRLDGLVGRDTEDLSSCELSRAAVETTAEGFVDGWLSPLFWLAVGGLPAMVTYRVINTLDSMVGYRTDRYAAFGWASARLDDAVNWLPARLSVPVIVLADVLRGGNEAILRFARAWHDRLRHPSPNAGHPEAAFAAVLHCRLGGPSRYGDRLEERPRMNAEAPPPGPDRLPPALDRLWTAVVLSLGLTAIWLWIVGSPVGFV